MSSPWLRSGITNENGRSQPLNIDKTSGRMRHDDRHDRAFAPVSLSPPGRAGRVVYLGVRFT